MTDETVDSDSTNDWVHAQRQYWDAWLTLIRQASKGDTASLDISSQNSPWIKALELYWNTLSPLVAEDAKEVFNKFILQGKTYLQFSGEFLKALQTFQHLTETQPQQDWQKQWDTSFAQFKENFVNVRDLSEGRLNFWALPLDNWQRAVAALSTLPGDFLQYLKPDISKQNAFNDGTGALLSGPTVGYTRQWQAQIQEGMRLWAAYQHAQKAYLNLFPKISSRALELMQEKVFALNEQQQRINSLRAIYDLWVDCNEAAYSEFVKTDTYAQTNAELINALMAWKRHEQKMVDEILGALNVPTRQEVNTLNLQLHQLRREIKSLQASHDEHEVEDLRTELKDLRAELAVVKSHQHNEAPPEKKPTRKRSATNRTKST